MRKPEAAEMLVWANRATHRTRQRRQAFWFPLLVFGALIVLAAPLYRNVSAAAGASVVGRAIDSSRLGQYAGGFFLRDPGLVSLYWAIALPMGYVATVLFYRYRARRLGVASSIVPYVGIGIALFAFLVLFSWLGLRIPGDLWVRGLTPLLTVAVGLAVLPVIERSVALAVFVVGFLALVLVANLYDIENLFARVALSTSTSMTNLLVCGTTLMVAGAVFWAVGRRSA